MEPFDAYKIYLGLKLHFTSPSYDFVKYGGKVSAKYESFTKRRDKYQFSKLSKKEDLINYIVSSMISDSPPKWPGDLLNDSANENYKDWLKRQQSLTYTFTNDLEKIDNLKESIQVHDQQHPLLLKLYMQQEVCIETLMIIDSVAGIFDYWSKTINDPIIWPSQKQTFLKYKPFFKIDKTKYGKIMINKYARTNGRSD